ncbi:MAG: PilN domain-containing protein [Methylococcales bacterium]|nr:PilN domain-containing protein [Methylococcales bacterium]
MVKINLLPWREELRKEKQQVFLTVLVAAIFLTCLLFGGVYWYIEDQKTYQTIRNTYLEDKIKEVEKKIKKIDKIKAERTKLRDKILVIEGLQASRSEIVHVFDDLRRITPKGIYLTDFIQLGEKLTFKGRTTAHSEVSALMDAIEASKWIGLEGTGLKNIDGRNRSEKETDSQFIILAKQLKKKPKEDADDLEMGGGVE